MADFLSDGALPMGMLFFAVTVLGFVRRRAGNVVARGLYPGVARKLGLRYVPSAFKNGVGKLEGTLEGFKVSVDPDDQRRIFVRFTTSPEVDLCSYIHNKRPKKGQQSFRPTSRVVSSQFRTAQAGQREREALNASEDLPAQLRPLKFLKQLKTLTVSSSGVTAIFDYGNPPYIPASVVEDVLPRLLLLAKTFEQPREDVSPEGLSAGPESLSIGN